MIDEKYKDHLYTLRTYTITQYQNSIFTISGIMLSVSFAFIDKVKGKVAILSLKWAWGFLIATIVLSLLSLVTGKHALDSSLGLAHYPVAQSEQNKDTFQRYSMNLHAISILLVDISFVLAVILFVRCLFLLI